VLDGIMMQRVGYLTVLLLSLSSLVLVACESDPIAPAGDISGYASLRDERGERLTDQSGMRIQLRGTNFSTLTDTAGRWTISGVPAGIYDLDYSKPGFASNQFRAFQFVGGGTAYLGTVVELIRSRADTMLIEKLTYEPELRITLRDTMIEVDTGWMQPFDTTLIPDRFIQLEGEVRFEDPSLESSKLYLRPWYDDLIVVPSANYEIGTVTRGRNVIQIDVQQPIQHGYPRGVPVEMILTTRRNNTWYFEPSARQRLVTDPHDLIRVTVTLPQD
jgi:hypothetical protein